MTGCIVGVAGGGTGAETTVPESRGAGVVLEKGNTMQLVLWSSRSEQNVHASCKSVGGVNVRFLLDRLNFFIS